MDSDGAAVLESLSLSLLVLDRVVLFELDS